MSSHYSVLNCEENATKEELKKQYKKLALITHPDKMGSNNSQEFHRINKAINVLENDLSRRQYDSQLIENRCEDRIINDELSIHEFTLNSETNMYSTDCRCGGCYAVSSTHLPDCQTQTSLIIDCNSCSLSVKLKF